MSENEEFVSQPPMKNSSIMEIITTKQPIDEGTRQWQLSGLDLIEEIRQRLKGKVYNIEKGEWEKISEPLMNEWGIGKICNMLSWYINKNVQLSYFEPDEISKLLTGFEKDLSFLFEYYWEKMEMERATARSVARWISDMVWAAVQRARYGGEKQFIEGTEQRRIIQTEGRQNEQKSWFDKIPILGGR